MGSADYLDLKEELIAGLVPGTADWLDFFDPDGPGPLLEADAHVLEDLGTVRVDDLRLELSPLTCSIQGVARWERTLGLQNSRVTLSGTEKRRRAQVIGRLREYGPPTKGLIQTILNAFLVYDDQTQIVVLESDRGLVRLANEKRWDGPAPFGPGVTAQASWVVWDDPRVSKGGVQVDLALDCNDLGTLEITIRAPDGQAYLVPQPIGFGARHGGGPLGGNLRVYAPFFIRHRPIFGTWTMDVTSGNVGDTLSSAIILVEALGRYYDWRPQPCDGLGAAMYEWAVVCERAKLGPGADLDGARDAVKRLSYARSLGNIVRKPLINLIGIPDLDDTIPDEVVPG